MKILIFVILIMATFILPAKAEEKSNADYLPSEFAGYMVYEGTNIEGEKVYVRKPVRYKLYTGSGIPEDNDKGYEYRDYRKERERAEEGHQSVQERNNINSAANYPIYFNE